jgi:hypothetical protein
MGSNEEKPRGPATSKFARQHQELSELAKAVLVTLDTRTLAVDPAPARRALAAFSGRLRVHAAMEQDALYPRLLASSDPEVAARARALLDEVGSIYQLFFDFLARFADAAAIARDPEGFSREAMFALHRLSQRMKRENEELYPMVDDLDPTSFDGRVAKR